MILDLWRAVSAVSSRVRETFDQPLSADGLEIDAPRARKMLAYIKYIFVLRIFLFAGLFRAGRLYRTFL